MPPSTRPFFFLSFLVENREQALQVPYPRDEKKKKCKTNVPNTSLLHMGKIHNLVLDITTNTFYISSVML